MKQFMKEKSIFFVMILIIFLCFFLTSSGYLAWLYHLVNLAPAGASDMLAMGLGYFLQALGIGVFAVGVRRKPAIMSHKLFVIILGIYLVFTIPSILIVNLTWTIIFGGFSNLFCGMIAGFYLCYLSKTDSKQKALIFGVGYGLATLASWILAEIGDGGVYQSNVILYICAVLTICVAFILFRVHQFDAQDDVTEVKEDSPSVDKILLVACAVVFLFSTVNQIGFSFSSIDLAHGARLEFSRLFYAAGLVLAGIVTDKNRKHGAVLTLGALIIPFVSLILQREVISTTILWALSYFATGFFSVYRIILFVDMAEKKKLWFLSGFGLLFGRIGEVLGTLICSAVSNQNIILVVIAAVFYAATIALFFWLYQKLYMPEADEAKKERERFQRFAVTHDLSPREKEVLTLLLAKETTASIAEQLFVSESTVKFHVHNLLQKTGCKNRKELAELFNND